MLFLFFLGFVRRMGHGAHSSPERSVPLHLSSFGTINKMHLGRTIQALIPDRAVHKQLQLHFINSHSSIVHQKKSDAVLSWLMSPSTLSRCRKDWKLQPAGNILTPESI